MHKFSLEVFQSWDIGPFPAIQHTSSINEEFRSILHHLVRVQIADLESPYPVFPIPLNMLNLMPQFDILLDEIVLALDRFQILPNLRRERVIMRPQINLPRELIINRRNVTRASSPSKHLDPALAPAANIPRIAVLQPRAANVLVFLVAHNLEVLHLLLGFLEEIEG